MRVAVITSDQRVATATVETPTAGPGQLLLQVEVSGICGSDLHALGFVGEGVVLGHEFVGRIVGLGPDVEGFSMGRRVAALPVVACKRCRFCLAGDPVNCADARHLGSAETMGSFAEFVVVDAQASVVVPESVPLEVAGMIEPLSIAQKIVERANARMSDRVVILGGGPIGLAVALWLRTSGVGTIIVSDPVASRRGLALKMGATHVVDPSTSDLPEFIIRETGGLADVVIECAGRPGTFAEASGLAALEGAVVIAGLHMKPEEFTRMSPFLKNLTIEFCCWYTVRHYRHTIHMLAEQRIDPSPMVTHRLGFDRLGEVLEELKNPNDIGKVLILNQV